MVHIGITASYDSEKSRYTLNNDYVAAVSGAGALPLPLTYTNEPGVIDDILGSIDGLVLSGGGDLDPALYGETRLELSHTPDPARDEFELMLCRAALNAGMPILAICRGHQVLNVALGGTLYQDIAAQYGDALKHPRYELPRTPVHDVDIEAGTRFADIVGAQRIAVNSRHHQGIKALGKGLVVTGRASDGLIEAVELPGTRFVQSVQWHPEALVHCEQHAVKLFNAFAAACK